MPIANPRLILRLHVAALMSLRPHKTALVVLDSHNSLRSIQSRGPILRENIRVHQVGHGDVDGRLWLLLETEFAIPRGILNR